MGWRRPVHLSSIGFSHGCSSCNFTWIVRDVDGFEWILNDFFSGCSFDFKYHMFFFPTCQVRVVRFYQSCRLLLPPPPPPPPSPRLLLPPDLNYSHPRQVLAAGPQPRPSQPSVGCRTPTTASPAQCWLPDLNHGHPGAVLAAGPQPPCQI